MKAPTVQGGKPSLALDPTDARSRIVELDNQRDAEIEREKWLKDRGLNQQAANGHHPPTETSTGEIMGLVAAMVAVILTLGLGVVWLILRYFSD